MSNTESDIDLIDFDQEGTFGNATSVEEQMLDGVADVFKTLDDLDERRTQIWEFVEDSPQVITEASAKSPPKLQRSTRIRKCIRTNLSDTYDGENQRKRNEFKKKNMKSQKQRWKKRWS